MEKLQSLVSEYCDHLERTRKQITESESTLQEISLTKENLERNLTNWRHFSHQCETGIEDMFKYHSSRLLSPVLDLVQMKLPLELREHVYKALFDPTLPRLVPKDEDWPSSANACTSKRKLDASDVFYDEFIFNEHIVGPACSKEIGETFLRITPIYFRGSASVGDVGQLLDIQLSNGKPFFDLIRNLRVYLRLEDVEQVRQSRTPALPVSRASTITAAELELNMYKTWRASLDGLMQMPFGMHTVKLEVCMLHSFSHYGEDAVRRYSNLVEVVKPIYCFAKSRGGAVKVFSEDCIEGKRMDVTKFYDLGAEQWEEVYNTIIIQECTLIRRSANNDHLTSY